MSMNLDKALDDITSSRRQGARGARGRAAARRAKAAGSGGIRKNKAAKGPAKAAQPAVAPTPTESKIMVSGLPADVNEGNIKEYFTQSAGPVKRVMLTYNQNGTSRGIASIVFSKPETAAKAAQELNGLLVDNKPMKIEVIVDASHAPGVPAPKPLTERIAQKNQPKPVNAAKQGRRSRRAKGRSNRPKPKSKEELDQEMVDYQQQANETIAAEGNAVNGQAQPATNGGGEDVGMAEIS